MGYGFLRCAHGFDCHLRPCSRLLCFWPEEKQACISDTHFEHAIRNGSACGAMRTGCWLCFNHPQWECLFLPPPGLNTQLLDDLSALGIGITNSLTSPDVTGAVT